MVVLLVILTIIVFVTVDYVIQRKEKVGLAAKGYFSTLPLSRIFCLMPKGIFLQPSFTWSKILDDGAVALGIQPVLMGLIGEPDEIVMLPPGEKTAKGAVLLDIRKGNKLLHVNSPVSGSIEAVNKQIVEEATCESFSRNWLFVVKPENVAQEVPSWLIAEKADAWIKRQYQQLRDFFIRITADTPVGMTMADGGEIPAGILADFDETVWQDFEKTFCDPENSSFCNTLAR